MIMQDVSQPHKTGFRLRRGATAGTIEQVRRHILKRARHVNWTDKVAHERYHQSAMLIDNDIDRIIDNNERYDLWVQRSGGCGK